MKQSDIFLKGEGDAWFARNKDRLGQRDLVSDLLSANSITPTKVLEIGCANGWRLQKLRDKYGCAVMGIDPSSNACDEAALRKIDVYQGTAEFVPATRDGFDLIIYGFCLYMTDPQDWFRIVMAGDAALADGGHIAIHDFETFSPYARPYEHNQGLLAYHVDFARMWLAHPLYHLVSRNVGTDEDIGVVTFLKKSPAASIKVRT